MRARPFFPALLILVAAGCGQKEPAATKVPAATPPVAEKPRDESMRFPKAGLIDATIVDDHVMGKGFLPGGNVANYNLKGKSYQLFLVRATSSAAAALLLFDYKGNLASFKYLPHFGGYFGIDGASTVFIFQKGSFLAGVAGLPEKDADPIAREFAVRLN